MQPQGMGKNMSEERTGAIQNPGLAAVEGTGDSQWQRTLWAMVGIQFIMTGAFSVLGPIMPLLLPELGVETASAVDLWPALLTPLPPFLPPFASPSSARIPDPHRRPLL